MILFLAPIVLLQANIEPTKQVIERKVNLVGPSVPVLKYQLLPPLLDRKPGNAASLYFKAISLKPEPPRDPETAQRVNQQIQTWNDAELEALPKTELKAYLTTWRDSLKHLDQGARATTCDWLADYQPRHQSQQLRLVTQFRELANNLYLRGRWELAEGRLTDALVTIQTGLQFGKHLGEGTNILDLLVGYAITTRFLDLASELTAFPQGPNLYWPLTQFEQQRIDPAIALAGEERMILHLFPELEAIEAGPIPQKQAQIAWQRALQLMTSQEAANPSTPGADLSSLARAVLLGNQAKDQLAKRGWRKTDLDQMPTDQALILRAVLHHREFWQDQLKLCYVPFPTAAAELRRNQTRRNQALDAISGDPLLATFSLIFPAADKSLAAHFQTARRVAMFRVTEAIRLQAAQQEGKLPSTLAEVAYPLSLDPITLKPFEYEPTREGYRLFAPQLPNNPIPMSSMETIIKIRK